MNRRTQAVTLTELLIAIALLSLVVLILSSIDLFSHYHLISSDRRAKVQNEVSYCLEHMSKEIIRAIGNEVINGANSVVRIDNIGADAAIRVYIDSNPTGGPGDGQRDTFNDRWIAYRFTDNIGTIGDRHQIRYCPQCATSACNTCIPAWGTAVNILSRKIEVFIPIKPGGGTLSDNFVEIRLTACWDPTGVAGPCGSVDNPSVAMFTRIKMPSVSTH